MTTGRLDGYARDPVSFIDDLIPLNEKGAPWRLSAYQRRVLALAFRWSPTGALLLRLLLWSEPKKSGKTFVAALLGLWWAFTNAYTEVIVAANDLDQSVGRVFATMVALCKFNPALAASVTVRAETIAVSNGTVITAIASDYKGAAGSRHSLALIDELWGFSLENAYRLYEELTPPPSEPNAWVGIFTTAGFTNESKLLELLYERGLAGERIDDELELTRADEMTMFWSHTARQPWQTEKYYAEQRRSLRESTFRRLHLNEWVSAESTFITPELWDSCVEPTWSELEPSPDTPTLYVGIDAATKGDTCAVVGVLRDGDQVVLAWHKIWRPSREAPLDLREVEEYVLDLHRRFRVKVVADPYQMARSITYLKSQGVAIEEYVQSVPHLTEMATALLELLRTRALVLYESAELREQALNATLVESAHGLRIAKEKASKKIDSLVALAMAVTAAVAEPVLAPARMW